VGVGTTQFNKTKGIANITIKPHFKSKFKLNISAYILPKSTSLIPSRGIGNFKWQPLDKLILADPTFSTSGPFDILLGADINGLILREGLIKGSIHALIAQDTTLGWIVSGSTTSDPKHTYCLSTQISINEELYHLLQRFWEFDTIPNSQGYTLSKEDPRYEDHFKTTHSRDREGRYIIRLPFKNLPSVLGSSKPKAIRMVTRIFNKFETDTSFAKLYSEFMTEYINMGHMRLIPDSEPEPAYTYYLHHHGVLKKSSLTIKLRVVFNGSSKTSSGITLDDISLTRPQLQNDSFDAIIWFRQFNYVFTEKKKTYRQIKVYLDDGKFQRILWRSRVNWRHHYLPTT